MEVVINMDREYPLSATLLCYILLATHLYFSCTQSTEENCFQELAEEPNHHKELHIHNTHASVRAEEVDHRWIELFLLHVSIADDQCRQEGGEKSHHQHPHT